MDLHPSHMDPENRCAVHQRPHSRPATPNCTLTQVEVEIADGAPLLSSNDSAPCNRQYSTPSASVGQHRRELERGDATHKWFYQVLTPSQWLQVCQQDGWSFACDAQGRTTLRVDAAYATQYAKNWIQPIFGTAVVARCQVSPELFNFPEPRSIFGERATCFDVSVDDVPQLLRSMTSPLRSYLVVGLPFPDSDPCDFRRQMPLAGMVDDVATLLKFSEATYSLARK